MKFFWFGLLFWSICLEGLGRKYLPGVPSVAFYLFKDAILLIGIFRFQAPPSVRGAVRYLYGGFQAILLIAFGWTFLEAFNPDHRSPALAALGLRAYWLWWLAPIVIAGVLQDAEVKRKAIYLLIFTTIGISALAVVQFASPATSAVNLYSVVNGEEVYADVATVASTGRVRVAGTFSFVSGFCAFTVLVPALLLSIGMGTEDKKLRRYALIGMSVSASVLPMSGSRGTLLMGAAVLVITAWTSGLLFTKVGRRVMVGVVAGSILAVTAFPDAILGLASRFEDREETSGRLIETFNFLPPVALTTLEYPFFGIGTGMQQNARYPMGLAQTMEWNAEGEVPRYLIELGPLGYLAFWTAKLGLCFALFRCYAILKRGNKRAAAGAALSYILLVATGNLVFDHVWQSLFFMGCGFILAETVAVLRQQKAMKAAPVEVPLRPAVATVRLAGQTTTRPF